MVIAREFESRSTAPARDLVRDDVVLVGSHLGRQGRDKRPDGPDGTLDPARIDHLAEQVSAVTATGAGGAGQLREPSARGSASSAWRGVPTTSASSRPPRRSARRILIRAYDEGFRRHGRHAAQLLLTHEDFDSRPRYLNMRNTLTALFEYNAVPVINENDTISVDEIKFGDNDRLAAMVTNLFRRRCWSSSASSMASIGAIPATSGRRGHPPGRRTRRRDPRPGGRQPQRAGTGGMRSKLQAARLVTQAGGSV